MDIGDLELNVEIDIALFGDIVETDAVVAEVKSKDFGLITSPEFSIEECTEIDLIHDVGIIM